VRNATVVTESGGDAVVTKYYFVSGKRIAMDGEGVVQWLVGDHLGSTSLVTDDQGSVVAESRHYPYGEERWRDGTVPTSSYSYFSSSRLPPPTWIFHRRLLSVSAW
jgi:hypothetical protein